jgi:hypothetical protein
VETAIGSFNYVHVIAVLFLQTTSDGKTITMWFRELTMCVADQPNGGFQNCWGKDVTPRQVEGFAGEDGRG